MRVVNKVPQSSIWKGGKRTLEKNKMVIEIAPIANFQDTVIQGKILSCLKNLEKLKKTQSASISSQS